MSRIYLARYQTDRTDGRGLNVPFAAFTEYADARYVAKEQTTLGVKGHGDVLELPLYPDTQSWIESQTAQIREKALAKLSREERAILGIPS